MKLGICHKFKFIFLILYITKLYGDFYEHLNLKLVVTEFSIQFIFAPAFFGVVVIVGCIIQKKILIRAKKESQ